MLRYVKVQKEVMRMTGTRHRSILQTVFTAFAKINLSPYPTIAASCLNTRCCAQRRCVR